MRCRIPSSLAVAVAIKAIRRPLLAANRSANALLPLRAPPRTRINFGDVRDALASIDGDIVLLLLGPVYLQYRRSGQRLHDDAILFCLLAQPIQLLRRCLRRINIKVNADMLKTDGDFL